MDRPSARSVLVAAADRGSFRGASRKPGIPLATVSRRVSELEAHPSTRLLNCTSRRRMLTEAGTSHVVACKQVLERIDEIERTATGEPKPVPTRLDPHTPSCPANRVRPLTGQLQARAGHPRLCQRERRGWPGIRASTPVFDGLCPAMTE